MAAKIGTGTPHTTLASWFAGQTVPLPAFRGTLVQLLMVCGVADDVGIERWLSAWERVRRAPGRRPGAPSPFRGLASFNPEDADWFFGREALTSELVTRVHALDAAGGGVLILVGASGAGKSSLLRAGLVAAMRLGDPPGTLARNVILMTPGSRPMSDLEQQLAALVAENTGDLREGQVPAESTHPTTRLANGAGLLLLVIDQFEEVFTEAEVAERRSFLSALEAAASGAVVVVALRADFYAAALELPMLRTAARDHQVPVGPMSRAELRQAIVKPARKARITIEEGLVEILVRDATSRDMDTSIDRWENGCLPLLSHVLYTTWKTGKGQRLRIEDYQRAGGITGAVASTADAIYAQLDARHRDVARRLFLALVHLAPDTPDTRRRVSRVDLFAHMGPENGTALEAVLEQFVSQRLITVDADAVELSHEAVLSAWPQLGAWIQADRSSLMVARQLAATAREWRIADRDPEHLYGTARLNAAQDWADSHASEVPTDVAEFLRASHHRARRRTRRLQQTVAALTVLLMATATGGILAVRAQSGAEAARAAAVAVRDAALSRLVAARADQLRAHDPSLSAQLSVAAYQIAATSEARASLVGATGVALPTRLLGGGAQIMQAVAFHPSGRVLAAAADTGIRIWDLTDPLHGHGTTLPGVGTGTVFALSYSPDGRLMASAGADQAVHLWSTAEDPTRPDPLGALTTGSASTVYSVAFSPDGHTLAVADADGTVRMWNIIDPTHPTRVGSPLPVAGGATKSVVFTPDNQRLVTGSESGTVRLWTLADPTQPRMIGIAQGPTKEVDQVAVSPDGRMLAAGSRDFSVYLWDITDPASPTPVRDPLVGARSWINTVAFSPDSTHLAAGGSDTALGVRIWDVTTGRLTATLPHPAPVTSVRFRPDGRTVATAANDGTARLWPVRGPVLAATGPVSAAVFSPDGRVLAVGSSDVQLWNIADPRAPTPFGPPLANPDRFSGSLAFSPDSRTLAVSHGASGTIRLWDTTDPARPVAHGPPTAAHDKIVQTVAFSPDGNLLATGADDATVRLWDTTSKTRPLLVATMTGFTGIVTWVTFSPDGRTVIASSADKTIRLWNVANPHSPTSVGGPLSAGSHYVYSVAYSPDGRTIAASSADSNIYLWNVGVAGLPRPLGSPLHGPTNYVYMLTFSPDGETLASATTDGHVWLWSLQNRGHPVPLAAVAIPQGALYTIGYHPGGTALAGGGAAGTTWLFTTDPHLAAQQICARTGDHITVEEWSKYIPDRSYQRPCRI
ncbi:WD40 repeat domain-containing protein [Longispora sp. NPDC051575]|uniref:WD40 repeat domain-containing protein n=1 Tax=Longispora sp. NPDC051575 TaxID=3154943 RepID=UPI003415712C